MSRTTFVRILSVPAVAALAVGIATLDPGGDRRSDADVAFDRALDDRLARTAEGVAYKQFLVGEMLAGRMTLGQVADEFLRVNAEDPAILQSILEKYPGADDREKSAHNVIAFARARCLSEAEADEVVARLSGEFARLFGHEPGDVT